MTFCRADVRFCGRCWGESGHGVLHRICLLLTQSGHGPAAVFDRAQVPSGPGHSCFNHSLLI
jgi:hypothetical protein